MKLTRQIIDEFAMLCQQISRTQEGLSFPNDLTVPFIELLAKTISDLKTVNEILIEAGIQMEQEDTMVEQWTEAFALSVPHGFDRLLVALKNRVESDPTYKSDVVFSMSASLVKEAEKLLGRFGLRSSTRVIRSVPPRISIEFDVADMQEFLMFLKKRVR